MSARTPQRVIVVGAGIGGLSAAIRLAASGARVTIFEAHARPGGKAGIEVVDGVAFDTGPSLMTMPHVFEDLFAVAGTRLHDELRLTAPDPAFRYLWPDGARFDVHHQADATLDAARASFGANASLELEGFLAHTRRIWEAAEPHFVAGPSPSLGSIVRLGLAGMLAMTRIDALRSMRGAIVSLVTEPHLRDVLLRYATYNGSDPRVAPATLNCIAWVELGLGGWGVEGGMFAPSQALVRVAERLGVEVCCSARVARIERSGHAVTGVALDDGRLEQADAVVVNADAAHLHHALLGGEGQAPRLAPSTSGLTAVYRAAPEARRVAHTVIFPERYEAEFEDMFDRGIVPRQPTVYLCDQHLAHGRARWPDAHPVFAMINAPAEPADGETDPAVWAASEEAMRQRAVEAGMLHAADTAVWRRSPTDLARQYPHTRGAIYGAASNDRFAAFRRPRNTVAGFSGLFAATGSAHPGGGVPLCALSGARAAVEAARHLGLPLARPAAT
jgi:phytoene desaturase